MELKYILLPNDSCHTTDQTSTSSINTQEIISYLLPNSEIPSLNHTNFSLNYNEATYNIAYSIHYEEQTNTIYLSFKATHASIDQSASIINYIRNEINNLSRDAYYIICSLDESSEYYCNNIYPLFNTCERHLRSLTYAFITKAFGNQWYEETFNEDQKTNLKEKIQIKSKSKRTIALIENSLYELTWFELIDYLFTVQNFKNLDSNLTPNVLNTKSKEQLLQIIEECRPQTKWEKYIMPLPDDDCFFNTLNTLRIHRNSVAHNKIFTENDYTYCQENLSKLIELIKAGDAKLNEILFTPQQQSEIIDDTCSNLTTSLQALSDTIRSLNLSATQLNALTSLSLNSPSMKALSNTAETLSAAIQSSNLSATQLNALTLALDKDKK